MGTAEEAVQLSPPAGTLPAGARGEPHDVRAATLTVCVFCGARSGRPAGLALAAREVGRLIGARGHDLIYGAGGTGLMGEVARSAWRYGSAVTGFVPRCIAEWESRDGTPQQSLHVTEDLFERKRRMIAHADAFIALPGGYGTLDEVLEIMSMRYLGIEDKPLILLDVDGFWDGLVRLLDSFYERELAAPKPTPVFQLTSSPAEALALAERLVGTPFPGAREG
jgi:uncharacterized protein (TIGR00730 family)